MRIEFDIAKDARNLAKHGVSLRLAKDLEWDAAIAWVDERRIYGEVRIVALVPQHGVVYFVAFVERSRARRIISLRRANRREVKRYVQTA